MLIPLKIRIRAKLVVPDPNKSADVDKAEDLLRRLKAVALVLPDVRSVIDLSHLADIVEAFEQIAAIPRRATAAGLNEKESGR